MTGISKLLNGENIHKVNKYYSKFSGGIARKLQMESVSVSTNEILLKLKQNQRHNGSKTTITIFFKLCKL